MGVGRAANRNPAQTVNVDLSRIFNRASRAVAGLIEAGYRRWSLVDRQPFSDAHARDCDRSFFWFVLVGAVLGVVLGGVIAAHWRWRAAFGVVGVPGLVLALLGLKVRDRGTVPVEASGDAANRGGLRGAVKLLANVPTPFF